MTANRRDFLKASLASAGVVSWGVGVPAFLTSASTGQGIELLRERLAGRTSVFSGQSGVGKSSLLNAVQPGLDRRVRDVSDVTQKGTHTTVTAELIRLDIPGGGWVVDTPGVRQFQLSSIRPEEVEGLFPDFRPFVPLCGFPDCTHTHEPRCAVRQAIADGLLDVGRYESYLKLRKELDYEEARTDPRAARERKEQERRIHREYEKHKRRKHGGQK